MITGRITRLHKYEISKIYTFEKFLIVLYKDRTFFDFFNLDGKLIERKFLENIVNK